MLEDDPFPDDEPEVIGTTEIVTQELINGLKEQRDDMMQIYAKLIANPYLATNLASEAKSNLVKTIALLLENNVPVEVPSKARTSDDVIKEGLVELGGMMGAGAVGSVLRAKKSIQDTIKGIATGPEADLSDWELCFDPEDGSYYLHNPETDEEMVCDKDGTPLE